MNIFLQFFLASLTLFPIVVQSESYASPFCPSTEGFNRATQHHSKLILDIAISYESYADDFGEIGITTPLEYKDLRLLETEIDSAVCQKLNEKYDDLDLNLIYDRELRLYKPAYFMLYYEVQDRYLAFKMNYNAGEADGSIGLGTMGWISIDVYDKQNLNFIGSLML